MIGLPAIPVLATTSPDYKAVFGAYLRSGGGGGGDVRLLSLCSGMGGF